MSCCGSRRAAFARAHSVRPAPPVPPTPAATALTYRGPAPMVLLGPVSRRVYRMAEVGQHVDVDPVDAVPLLRTAWFAARLP